MENLTQLEEIKKENHKLINMLIQATGKIVEQNIRIKNLEDNINNLLKTVR